MFLKLAHRYRDLGHYLKAFEYYDLTLKTVSDPVLVLDEASQLAMQVGEYAKATRYYAALCRAVPASSQYQHNYALACFCDGQFSRAESLLQALRQKYPEDHQFLQSLDFFKQNKRAFIQKQTEMIAQTRAELARLFQAFEILTPNCPWLSLSQEHARIRTRQIVFILGAKGSGTTYLHQLLAKAEDVSWGPAFRMKPHYDTDHNRSAFFALAQERIILLNYPADLHDVLIYPTMPISITCKYIVLVRDAYETIQTLRNPSSGHIELSELWTEDNLLRAYWLPVYARLLGQPPLMSPQQTCFVRFEDLMSQPVHTTRALWAFMGSQRTEGVAIETEESLLALQEQKTFNQRLRQMIETSQKAHLLRKTLGYLD